MKPPANDCDRLTLPETRVGEGTRTPDIQIHSLNTPLPNRKSSKEVTESPDKPLAYSLARETENDPALAPIMAAWPELPEAIRQVVSAWKDLPEAARQALVSAAQLALAVLEPSSSTRQTSPLSHRREP